MKSFVGLLVAVLAAVGIRCGMAADGELPLSLPVPGDAVARDADGAGMQPLDCCACEPIWRVRANALWLRLSQPNDSVLATDFSTSGEILLNASEFKFVGEPGCEIALLGQITDNWNLEARLFRIDGWNATRDPVFALGSVVQYSPTPPGFGNAFVSATIAGSYRAELSSVEINGRRQINDFWSLLLGFRYLGLDDGLTIVQDFGPGFVTATHGIRAVNDLYGFQLGADMNLWTCGRWSIEGLVKAGVYGDHAVSRVHIPGSARLALVLAEPQVASYDTHASASQAAFAGEMSITGVYRFSQHLSLRGGYQYLWLAGVARASDQVAVSDPLAGTAAVSFKGSPSYDGAFVGLEFAR